MCYNLIITQIRGKQGGGENLGHSPSFPPFSGAFCALPDYYVVLTPVLNLHPPSLLSFSSSNILLVLFCPSLSFVGGCPLSTQKESLYCYDSRADPQSPAGLILNTWSLYENNGGNPADYVDFEAVKTLGISEFSNSPEGGIIISPGNF